MRVTKHVAVLSLGALLSTIVLSCNRINRDSAQYCVDQVIQALKIHDAAKFQQYADTKTLATPILDQLFTLQDDEVREEEVAILAHASGGATRDVLRPMLYVETQRCLDDLVKVGIAPTKPDERDQTHVRVYFQDMWLRMLGSDTCFVEVDSVKAMERETHASLRFRPCWGPATLELQMEKGEKGWRLTKVSGLDDVIRKFNQWEQSRVDSINACVEKRIGEALTLEEVKIENRTVRNSFNRLPAFTVHASLQNKFDKEVTGVNGTLLFHFRPQGKWCFGPREKQYKDTALPLRMSLGRRS